VLKTLAKPSSPDLLRHLQLAARTFVHGAPEACLSRAVGSDLVPRLLAILRSLPSHPAPDETVAVCAAATAVLNNMMFACNPQQAALLRDVILADEDALCEVVRWGIAGPTATEQLPPGHEVYVTAVGDFVPGEAVMQHRQRCSHQFWTPLTICSYFLVALHCSRRWHQGPALAQATAPVVIQRLLRLASQHPCGR
jgi:hypothetical protein